MIHDSYAFFITFRQSQLKLSKMPLLKIIPRYFVDRAAMIFHHILIITVGLIVMHPITRGSRGDFFIGCLFAMELSSPFVSLHFVAKRLHLKGTVLYYVNGVLVFLFFLTVRIIMFPFLYIMYAIQYHHGNIITAITSMCWICHLFMMIGFLLNFYWFTGTLRLLIEGAKNLFSTKEKQN